MTAIPRITTLILALAFLLPANLVSARQLVDQAGRTVEVPDRPQRVIALAPSIVEVVYELGRQDLLKGATQYSTEPPAARSLPRVGSYVRLDLEKIVALEPDLCLAIKDGNPLPTVNRLVELGIPVYVVDPRSIEGVMEMISRLGEVLGADAGARELVSGLHRRVARVRERLAGTTARPSVFFQIDAAPIVSAGRGTFIDELITLAGGRNLAATDGAGGYLKFSWEDVLRFAPEVVIVASMAGGYSEDQLKTGWRQWPQVPAVKNGRLYVLSADLVDRPTPRLIDGLEAFAGFIHPELFGNDTSQ